MHLRMELGGGGGGRASEKELETRAAAGGIEKWLKFIQSVLKYQANGKGSFLFGLSQGNVVDASSD